MAGEVVDVATITALPPRDPGVYALIAALVLVLLPALFAGVILILLAGSCTGVILAGVAFVLRPRTTRARTPYHFKLDMLGGQKPLVLMIEANGAPTVG
ncbi:MAG: hypothetical protein ACRDHE_10325, partial [Ktedonobacterales bacterium]